MEILSKNQMVLFKSQLIKHSIYRFLITLLHELAHYDVCRKYAHYIKPHGKEWKFTFKKFYYPF